MFKLNEVRVCLKEGEGLYDISPIETPEDAVALIGKQLLSKLDREMLTTVNLDSKNRPISYHIVSVGSITSSLVYIPNVFKTAILENATSIIVLHNHPSGDVSPSLEDIAFMDRVTDAGSLLSINVLDHIIIGSGKEYAYYSFREEGHIGRVSEDLSSTTKYVSDSRQTSLKTQMTNHTQKHAQHL